VIGAIAGWLAGLIVRGAGFGLIGNIVIGIIGAFVASWILPAAGRQPRRQRVSRHHQCYHRRGDRSRHPLAGQTRLTPPLTPIATAEPAVVSCSDRGAPLRSRTNNKANAR